MNKLDEKLKEYHKVKTRTILWYVRDSLLLEEARKTFDDKLKSVDSWKQLLSDDDLVIADMLITSGIDLQSIIDYQDLCEKQKGIVKY